MADSPAGGFLPISDAMGRDLDNGRADNKALDDFIPDTVLQEMKDRQDAQTTVRAQDLIPISKADAARRTTFGGETMPSLPKSRRVIPAPYRRDRVVGGKHGKSWHEMAAAGVEPGDIIPDVGLVQAVSTEVRHGALWAQHIHEDAGTVDGCPGCFAPAEGLDVIVYGGDGQPSRYDSKVILRVFR